MVDRDLSYLERLGHDRVVISLHAGLSTGPARGAVLKLAFADKHSELVFLPPGWVGIVSRQLGRFLADFRPNRNRDAEPIRLYAQNEPELLPSDYSALQQDDVVTKIGMLASTNAVGLEFEFSDGRRRGFLMVPLVASHLRGYLDEIAPLVPPIPGVDIPDPQR